jgi:5-methylcytosine-specific restriction endonuclease McrA
MKILVDKRAKKAARLMAISKLSINELAENIKKASGGFLQTPEWKALRQKVIQHYGGKCMCCGKVPDRGVNVDHIKPRKTHPHLSLEFDNLQVLCSRCNKRKGNRHETDYRNA